MLWITILSRDQTSNTFWGRWDYFTVNKSFIRDSMSFFLIFIKLNMHLDFMCLYQICNFLYKWSRCDSTYQQLLLDSPKLSLAYSDLRIKHLWMFVDHHLLHSYRCQMCVWCSSMILQGAWSISWLTIALNVCVYLFLYDFVMTFPIWTQNLSHIICRCC